jgi:hypothetical protein
MRFARFALVSFAVIIAPVAQAPFASAQSTQRASSDNPGLEGVWVSRWITPLERPKGVAKLVLTAEETKAAEAAEWLRHNAIDPIEGTESFEFTHFVIVRGEHRSSLIVDPADGKLPYTEKARALRIGARPQTGTEGPEQRALNERCLSGGNGFAPHLTAPSSNIRQIVVTPRDVMIWTELLSQLRIIPTDGRTDVGARNEHTTGRWADGELVVNTTGIRETTRGARGNLFPVTRNTVITERFALSSADEILYRFTVHDPELYTQDWTAETVMARTADRMYEFACHEGNYGLYNILLGARVVEARPAKKSGARH